MLKIRTLALTFTALVALSPSRPASAKIVRLEILRTEPAFGGASFGDVGTYDRVVARAHGEIDPANPANAIIQDLGLALRNAHGMVEYTTEIDIARPTNPAKTNHILFFDVVNRGSKRLNVLFNADVKGTQTQINNLETAGDGWLQTLGTTMIWAGWQGDILPGDARLTANLPVARNRDGSTLTGVVRSELTTQAPVTTLNLSSGWFTGMTHAAYPTVETDNAKVLSEGFRPTLTIRAREGAPREIIPTSNWHFGACEKSNDTQICLPDGFQPGKLYEVIYRGRDPKVMGLGFAITRDVAAFFQHADRDAAGTANPVVHGAKTRSIVFGQSQSGRFIRSLLALGFNKDESGKKVFDGAMPHIGGGLMPLNTRFSQPGRAWGQQVDHDYPAYDFPFTYARETDPLTGRTQGLLDRCEASRTCPLIFHTATALEIWEGRQSLGLTDPLGLRDAKEPANVRTYILASTQHAPPALPLPAHAPFGLCQQQSNPNPHTWTLRAAFSNMVGWVRDGKAPPASIKPSISAGTLVAPDRVKFPVIPATNYGTDRPAPRYTGVVSALHVLDFGPNYHGGDSSGVITREPPLSGTASYGILVPQVDSDGIDIGGVRSVYVSVPIGTYTSWNTFRPALFDGNFCNFSGSFIPFAATKAERDAVGDPRPSLEERYPSKDAYVAAVTTSADALVASRMLLPDDAKRLIGEAVAKGVRSGP